MSRFIVFFIINICLFNEILLINGNTTGLQDTYHNLTSKAKNQSDDNLIRTKRECAKKQLARSKTNDDASTEETVEWDYSNDEDVHPFKATMRQMPVMKPTESESKTLNNNVAEDLSKKIQNLIKLIDLLIIAAENNMKMYGKSQITAVSEEKPVMGARRIQTVQTELRRKMTKRQKLKPDRRTTSPNKLKRNDEPHRKTVEWSEVASLMANNKRKSNH